MDEVTNLFYRYTTAWEQNIRGPQIGCYSVAIIGLTVALRKVRPFSKFKRATDIPDHFIKERRELTGYVKGIEPGGGVLMIQHKPLVDLPMVRTGDLPVKISGVKVSALGVNWLQAIVVENEVKFIPIRKDNRFIQCEVLLPQTKNKKVKDLHIGETLLRIGFGQIEKVEKPLTDPTFLQYYKRLKSAEAYAIRRDLGYKYYINPTIKLVKLMHQKLNDMLLATTKQIPRLYKFATS
ncbi:unnamed protein product [Brassicogethes aeneus]|uniref:Uncharacterized protein n=1 Tax=Brassicogethes aeneus TaxID=1431903 RepID=A0A9P0FCH0_BRAAE|nr:unnamed protein product [Brassicogethes aeneus]